MKRWLILCAVYAILFIAQGKGASSRAFPCPDVGVITPCTCSGASAPEPEINITCNALITQQMVDIFAGEFLFPQVYVAKISGSTLPRLPSDVFGDKILSYLSFTDNVEVSFTGSSPFTSSKGSLISFTLSGTSSLDSFDLSVFNGFTSLVSINITNNPSSRVTGNTSLTTLEVLNLMGNELTQYPAPSLLRNLKLLDLSHNHIPSIAANTFASNTFLETVNLNHNFLARLVTGALKFNNFAVKLVNVSNNQISTIERDAIVVQDKNAVIDLSYNYLELIEPAAFEALLTNMRDNAGKVILTGNPITCDCSIAWLILAPDLLAHTEGARCGGTGDLLTSLDPSYFQQFCP